MNKFYLLLLVLLITLQLFAQDVSFKIFIEKETYVLGERVYINMVIFNNTLDTIKCTQFKSYKKEYYSFNLIDGNGVKVNQYIIGLKHADPTTIAPGSYLKKWLDITEEFANKDEDIPDQPLTGYQSYGLLPGVYTFQIEYQFEINPNEADKSMQKLTSNTVAFSLLPISNKTDSIVAAIALAHNNKNFKNNDDYEKAIDSIYEIGKESSFYAMIILEKIGYTASTSANFSNTQATFLALLDELVNLRPNSWYAYAALSSTKYFKISREIVTYYEQLLKDNVFLNPTLNGKGQK